MKRAWAALVLIVTACSHRAPPGPAPSPHYVVGGGYRLGDTWSYPREQFRYDATGLAERMPVETGMTADGERADSAAMTGAHRTLQLPAIVDVTNLDTGRQVRIRLNDRGPATRGRLVGLSQKVADLLGMPATGAVPVRVTLDSEASQAVRDQLDGGPRGITAAPVAAVTQEALPEPGQARPARVAPQATAVPPSATPQALERLPETVRSVPVQPGQLWIRVDEFTQRRYAEALKSRLVGVPAHIEREGSLFVVQAGPFASVAAADAELDRIGAAGVTNASIVVE